MLITLPEVFSPAEAAAIGDRLAAADWVDGRGTAGAGSALVKANRQLDPASPLARDLGETILARLWAHPEFLAAALPLRVLPPLFNAYGPGEAFGIHVDNAIRRAPGWASPMRTDLSATLFLADPDSYDGGELTIETTFGAQTVKLPAGHMVLYPASSLHMVSEVARGTRLASFFWIQSMVRDDGARELLFDLDRTIRDLAAEHGLDDAATVRLTGIYHNLLRRWAET